MLQKLFPKIYEEVRNKAWLEGYEAGERGAVFVNWSKAREQQAYDNAHHVALEASRQANHGKDAYQERFDEVYKFLIEKKPSLD